MLNMEKMPGQSSRTGHFLSQNPILYKYFALFVYQYPGRADLVTNKHDVTGQICAAAPKNIPLEIEKKELLTVIYLDTCK